MNTRGNTAGEKPKHPQSGFTLIELMIVVAIIAILSAAAMIAFTHAQDRARVGACKSSLGNIRTAMESFYAEEDSYPLAAASFDDLAVELQEHIDFNNQQSVCEFVSYASDNTSYELVAKVGKSTGKYQKLTASQLAILDEPF